MMSQQTGDLISREDTLTAFADYVGSGMSMNDYDALWDIVAKMPSKDRSVQDFVDKCRECGKQKTGHWIVWDTSSYDWTYKCDKCGNIEFKQSNYCSSCGCRMVEPQERNGEE